LIGFSGIVDHIVENKYLTNTSSLDTRFVELTFVYLSFTLAALITRLTVTDKLVDSVNASTVFARLWLTFVYVNFTVVTLKNRSF